MYKRHQPRVGPVTLCHLIIASCFYGARARLRAHSGTCVGVPVLRYSLRAHGCVCRGAVVTATACLPNATLRGSNHQEQLMPLDTVRTTGRRIAQDTGGLGNVQGERWLIFGSTRGIVLPLKAAVSSPLAQSWHLSS